MTEVENLMREPQKRFQSQMARCENKLNEVAADTRGITAIVLLD